MPLSDALLPEFDVEMANTRKSLSRVPDGKFDFKPHEKSPTMGWLASHVANLPTWVNVTINDDSIDINPVDGPKPLSSEAKTTAELLERFDNNIAAARALIASTTDEKFGNPWTLKAGGKDMFTMPKAAILRSFVISHLIHHRAQLGVYLRLNDVPVPALYGPTADESPF